ncbi:hypothetical protein ANN_25351 [Periplaneta americana]|uniref:Endonuclease/exonuclease/phosphatase domain-containing protein n=1 Tax=Periplaneta americana TaxID=6978 RepID=A0ABQ8S1B1_PERAM|nr:hypothetical protein ANN_25351 [Periplaneta americana]
MSPGFSAESYPVFALNGLRENPENQPVVIVGPYHHGMARPQIADRGDGLQICRVAVNILNKQSWTADEGWSSSLGLGEGLTTHHRKKQLVTYPYNKPRNGTDSLARPQQRNKVLRFGTWNVTSLYRTGGVTLVAKELARYRIDFVGVQERPQLVPPDLLLSLQESHKPNSSYDPRGKSPMESNPVIVEAMEDLT